MFSGFVGSSDKKAQYKIYALFLMADGQWHQKEQNFLNTISNKMELDAAFIRETTNYCKGLKISSVHNSSIIIREIDQVLSNVGGFSSFNDLRFQAETIWTLINLGHADQDYSEEEKNVVAHLIEKWKIKPEIVAEFTDTAETLSLLTKQRDWVGKLGLTYEDLKKRWDVIAQQIELMFDNIRDTISEADAM